MERMREAFTVIPTVGNDGTDLLPLHKELSDNLCARFGGVTRFATAGLWQNGADYYSEEGFGYIVAMPENRQNDEDFHNIVAAYARKMEQCAVYIRYSSGESANYPLSELIIPGPNDSVAIGDLDKPLHLGKYADTFPDSRGNRQPLPIPRGKHVWRTDVAGDLPIRLFSKSARHKAPYAVCYGLQVDENLTRSEAAEKIGAAILHALECEGRLD